MWDEVELFDSDATETVNVGAQEYGSSFYQVNTLVKISSSEKVLSNPKLQASNLSHGFTLVADKSVVVLDTYCAPRMLNQFETEVDIVSLCQEGHFLVAGERSGNLHLIHVPLRQTLLTRMLVQKSSNDRTYLNLHLEKDSTDKGTYHAFILTRNGVFCIMHLPLGKTQKAIDTQDFSTAKKLQDQVETCFISMEEYHTAGCLTSVTRQTENKIALIIGATVQQLQVADNLLYTLDDENVLSTWDVHSFIMVWDWPSVHIEEFLLIQGSVDHQLIALTQPDGDKQMRNLVVFALPAMHQLYSLEVMNISSVVQSGMNTDTIYFLEGIYENNLKSSDIPVSFLVMRCLTEAAPEDRLSRLLHKHKFTEAESFALHFGLEVELVYKMRVSSVLEKWTSESVDHDGRSSWLELVAQVKENLNKIKDNQFAIECCLNTPWPAYEVAYEMLSYAENRVSNRDVVIIPSLSNRNSASLTTVLQAQARLTTFYGAFGPEKFSGTTWLTFLNNEDVFEDILLQLREGNLFSASYLWKRHQGDFAERFSVEMLENLLDAISATISRKELCLWFKDGIIPFINLALPQGQKIIAKWLEQQARNLELTGKASWPENGLEMAQVFFTCNPDKAGVASSLCWTLWKDDKCEEVRHLARLIRALRDLIDLHRKYNCKLTLYEFEKENATTIVFRMFDRVLVAELIPAALEKIIEPYMCQHDLQKDEILLKYIKDLLERYCTRSASVFYAAWEAKAIAVLGCMSNMDLKFEGVLAIMHSTVVPWSPGVEQLVEQYLEMDHAKAKLLQEGYRLMEMKTVLLNYGIRNTSLLNDKQEMLRVSKYIVKRGTPSSLEDALKIAKVYVLPTTEIYKVRIMDLIDKDKGEEVLDLLTSLPLIEAVEMAERTVICGKLLLENKVDNFEELKMQLSVKKMVVNILKFLLNIQKENLVKKVEYETDLDVFKILVTLQENFDIMISAKDYENPILRSQLLEDHIKAYGKTQEDDANSKDSRVKKPLSELRLYRLASLLQQDELELVSELVLKALDAGQVEEALKICRDFYERHLNEQAGELLFLACRKLCHTFDLTSMTVTYEGLTLPEVVHSMACKAATICSRDLLLDAAELCRYTSLACEIYDKCQIEDTGVMTKAAPSGAEKDPGMEWALDYFFTEEGAVLDPPVVLPIAYDIASWMLPLAGFFSSTVLGDHAFSSYVAAYLAEQKRDPLDCTSLAHSPLIPGKNLCLPLRAPMSVLLDKLQECSQHELSLRLIHTSLGSVAQHVIGDVINVDLAAKMLEVLQRGGSKSQAKCFWSDKASSCDFSMAFSVCQLHNPETVQDAVGSLTAVMQYSQSKIKNNVMALLHKVFNSRHIDHDLARSYCSLLPKESCYGYLWDMINKIWQNYTKVLSVAFVGAQLASCYNDAEEKQKFEELMIDAEWGKELGKLGISFHHVFRTPSIRKKELLRTLVKNPQVKSDLVLKYCRSFQLDSDVAFQLYIEALLQNASTSDDEEEYVGDSEKLPPASVVARATEIIPLLKSTNSLVINLNAMLYKLDPYDYKTIESLLMIMEKAGGELASVPLSKAVVLIEHLKSYKRTAAPGDLEHQYAFKRAVPFSPAAQDRLPFHLIFFKTSQCFWKIITPELNEESFPKIFLISKIMQVSLDTLHMCAANQAFQERLKPKILEQVRSGSLLMADKGTTEILSAIQSHLLCIANPERSAALAHAMARELQSGPIKVEAMKFCVFLGEKWLAHKDVQEDSREKARTFLQKMQVEYRKRATEAVLMTHKLNSEEHLKLTGKPARLVVVLYQHSTIAERFQNPAGNNYPDIHAAAKEIAKINDLDMKKIWDTLLEKCLCSNEAPTERTSEMVEKMADETFKRLVYILQLQPADKGFRILYDCATSTTSPIGESQLTFAQRSIALKCLIYSADSSTVEFLFKKSIEEVRIFLKTFIYLSEFELLNIPYTYVSFHKAPKEGVIKGLWKNHSHDPRAVKLVTELSLEYQVWDAQLWNGLLQKMIDFNMVDYLRKVLVTITGIHSLLQIPNFSRAWQNVILVPFHSVSCPPSPSELEACCASLKALLQCPVLGHLDVIGIAKKFMELQLLALALGCLWLIPQTEKRDQQIQSFLASYQQEKILQQIKEHVDHCGLAGFASEIRYLVLEFTIKSKCFVATEYLPYLKLREMGADRLKGLVKYLESENRTDDAAALIKEYLKESGNPVSDQSSSELVKMFLWKE
ncbi:kinetochore-associated protein 1 [Heteronotia binoei]|uniref:kinetochore-associated protein 1 n=1 Tax=Heteronotia binoei TaxID=13085 RepID=UPI00292EBD6D|nr:kinetochore-associated protein 1 [Heteronotia binoei]